MPGEKEGGQFAELGESERWRLPSPLPRFLRGFKAAPLLLTPAQSGLRLALGDGEPTAKRRQHPFQGRKFDARGLALYQ